MENNLNDFLTLAVVEAKNWEPKGLEVLILDDWRGGPRLIYQFAFTSNCPSSCKDCPLFLQVGSDSTPLPQHQLLTTLILASPEDHCIFPSQQDRLNCKTWKDYLDCFIAWLEKKCYSSTDFVNEVKLIAGFHLIFYYGTYETKKIEMAGRKYIIKQALKRIKGKKKRQWLIKAAEQLLHWHPIDSEI